MKKEGIAALLLVLLLAAALVNIHFLNKLTGEVAALAEETAVLVKDGSWEKARKTADKALERWGKSDTYTHMVLRHSEIEAAGDTLGELLREVYAKNQGSAEAAAKIAADRMRSVVAIEKVRLGSIF